MTLDEEIEKMDEATKARYLASGKKTLEELEQEGFGVFISGEFPFAIGQSDKSNKGVIKFDLWLEKKMNEQCNTCEEKIREGHEPQRDESRD